MQNYTFYQNGFIIQKPHEYSYPMNYSGIEGDNWFLDEYAYPQFKEEVKKIYNIYRKSICLYSGENDGIECCTDMSFLNDYIKICKKINIDANILFCESLISKPLFNTKIVCPEDNFKFMGFDYAYLGGSFYSCILNDICFKRIKEFSNITLNNNGLFFDIDETINFIQIREKLLSSMPGLNFEHGYFTIYKIWKKQFI